MALNSTIFRFKIKLSDVDRAVYTEIELRVAMHPSESLPFLLTRVIAYSLNLQEGLTFTQGISSPDDPALEVRDLTGSKLLWIDIGNPSAKRIHKATKAAEKVRIYTYRDPKIMDQEVEGVEVYRKEHVEVFSLTPKFLNELGATLERDNKWELLHTDGELTIAVKDTSVHGELGKHRLGG